MTAFAKMNECGQGLILLSVCGQSASPGIDFQRDYALIFRRGSPMRLAVKNWTEFQHYKHRKPPWIRLHRRLMDDIEWHRLPLASRALAPMLWLLASETMNGVIDGASEALAFRLRLASTDFEEAL